MREAPHWYPHRKLGPPVAGFQGANHRLERHAVQAVARLRGVGWGGWHEGFSPPERSTGVGSRPADNPGVTGRLYQDYFDLQLRFAARHAALSGLPFTEAIDRCTNLRRRLGLWGPAGDAGWAAFLARVQGCSEQAGILRMAMAAHDSAPRRSPSPFGCFTYDPPDALGTLRLHFMPEQRHRQTSPLAGSSLPERRAELRTLFATVRRLHPGVIQVRGLSWLYHVQAYKGLFPPAYVASLALPAGPVSMTGSSTWGQVLDYRQRLKPGIAERVLAGLDASTLDAPWLAFPLLPLTAACSAEHFLDWFV